MQGKAKYSSPRRRSCAKTAPHVGQQQHLRIARAAAGPGIDSSTKRHRRLDRRRRHGCHADGVPRGDLQRHPSFLRVQSLGKLPAWSYTHRCASRVAFLALAVHIAQDICSAGTLVHGDSIWPERASLWSMHGQPQRAKWLSPRIVERPPRSSIYISLTPDGLVKTLADRRRTSHDDGPYPTAVSLR
jgi:hypothetical protein